MPNASWNTGWGWTMGKTCSPNTEEGPALRQHETATSPWVEERLAWSLRRDRRSVRRRQLGRDRKRALEPSEPLTPAEHAQALLQLALRASSPPPSQRPLQPGVRLVSSHLVVTVWRSLSWGQPPECSAQRGQQWSTLCVPSKPCDPPPMRTLSGNHKEAVCLFLVHEKKSQSD